MKLSTRARYALRMMIAIARQGNGSRAVSLAAVAEKTLISRRYLEQLAIPLKTASLIRGISGRAGGYRLARPPDKILLGEIVEAAIGPINIVDCVREPEICLKADVCECRTVYQLINDGITDVLNRIRLDQMADESKLVSVCNTLDTKNSGCPTVSQ